MNYDLFNPPPENKIEPITANRLVDLAVVKGLKYVTEFLSNVEHDRIWTEIYSEPWLGDLKRRVQHYGWKYDYKVRSIDYSMYLGKLPPWAKIIANRLFETGYMSDIADQLIVNEYKPGQGISPHVDCEPCFGNTIVSISMGSSLVMDLVNLKSKQKIEILLEPNSLIVISDEARYKWTHGIAARKTDVLNNQRIDRRLRISLTFRKVTLNSCEILK